MAHTADPTPRDKMGKLKNTSDQTTTPSPTAHLKKKQVIPSLGNGGQSRWLCEDKEQNLTIKVMLKLKNKLHHLLPSSRFNLTS
jgi:hypothetical protein